MAERVGTVVVGGGQAGLAVSHELTEAGVEHVVLERRRVGETWRGRWDSFCLVTPNWSVQLPDGDYDGNDPDGFMPRDDLVEHLERYAAGFGAPVREGVEVTSLRARPDGELELETSAGDIVAETVVLGTGAYQRPHRPHGAASLPPDLLKIGVEGYRNPGELPDGRVLVVGSGQSGCQIAEELHEAGREVFLACGRAGWGPRRLGDRDLFWWLHAAGDLDDPLDALPDASRGSRATSRRPDAAAATTCTTGPSSAWASRCSAISSAPTAGRPASRPTSARRSRGRRAEREGHGRLPQGARRLGLPELDIPRPS